MNGSGQRCRIENVTDSNMLLFFNLMNQYTEQPSTYAVWTATKSVVDEVSIWASPRLAGLIHDRLFGVRRKRTADLRLPSTSSNY